MDLISSFVAFSGKLYRGERELEWPLLFYLQPYTKRFLIWYNTSDWNRTSTLTRVKHSLIFVSLALYWFAVVVKLTQERVTLDNIVDFCKSFSLFCGGFLTMGKFIHCWRHRKRMSILLETITKKVEFSRREASQKRKIEANYQFLLLSWGTIVILAGGFLLSTPILLYNVLTGERYIQLAFPAAFGEVTPYSAPWWIECGMTFYIFIISNLNYTTVDAMLLDAILQVGWLFRFQYDKLENLNPRDEDLNRKLGTVVAELVELKELTEEYLDIIWCQQFTVWSVAYIALGFSAICLLLVLDTGIVEILTLLFYPAYVLFALLVWSTAGTHFREMTSGLNSSLFNSEWPNMPVSSRKTVAILMTFGQKTPTMDIEPFYEQSLFGFAQIMNKTYTLIALVFNFLGDM